MKVVVCQGENPKERTRKALEVLSPSISKSYVLIKPNLVEPMRPDTGAVTRPEVVEGIINFLGENYKIIIGESSSGYNTKKAFELAGYNELERDNVEIVDFDNRSYYKLNINGRAWKDVEVTDAVKDKYIISVASLKEHPFSVVTLCLKNMMGILKPEGSLPNKSYIHDGVSEEMWAERLCDLLEKIKPQLAVIDGTTGMYGNHLHGTLKKHNLTITSEDPVSADIVGAEILGDKYVPHISKALERKLGEKPEIERVNV
ncbi:MAG: DUF362 domain-containing protein [Thermoplasmatales archaeon]|nr:MAG: DUF362 domain-containing protein [Thermoplasmatales archaeon]